MTSLEEGGRTCARTGVRLVPASGGHAFRVAKDRGRPALEGYPNSDVGPLPTGVPDRRGRWDTVGSTVYFADTPQTAFAEVLAPMRVDRLRLAVAAGRAGYSVEEYVEAVLGQSAENDVDRPWSVSCRWQYARSIYQVWMPTSGWWVQIDHADTLMAIQAAQPSIPGLPDDLWSGALESADRGVTTLVAEWIRGLELDDGTRPLGIWFQSRTLMGRCWAWWDRRGDDGLSPGENDPRLLGSTNVDTPALREVAAVFDLPVLDGKPF
ncbi:MULTISPECIES: RES domain-containing protein [unclassified Cellulomonas]|uniref:RES domain-containing protein n=1 Tax=unclassified Cellulomonas TaxID=2620175 RepID=UPI001C4FDB2E|nr:MULTISPECIES: RES domain-containing protein [unclassified Cellulomonas]MBW0254478.1 RES domain-containing protein [Cellulomonas sp. PS-H5]MCG7284705.1 RES domain-containing protein [Cellulomonas sp. ACRRI]